MLSTVGFRMLLVTEIQLMIFKYIESDKLTLEDIPRPMPSKYSIDSFRHLKPLMFDSWWIIPALIPLYISDKWTRLTSHRPFSLVQMTHVFLVMINMSPWRCIRRIWKKLSSILSHEPRILALSWLPSPQSTSINLKSSIMIRIHRIQAALLAVLKHMRQQPVKLGHRWISLWPMPGLPLWPPRTGRRASHYLDLATCQILRNSAVFSRMVCSTSVSIGNKLRIS